MKKTKTYHVEPLRTADEIEEMKWAIKRRSKGSPKRLALAERDVVIFLLGISTGLRVNDIVRLKIGDVRGKKVFYIRESKMKSMNR